MARSHPITTPQSFTADVDLSSTCALYRFVTVASTYDAVKLATGGSNPLPLGVLQNSPSQNSAAEVVLFGPTILTGRASTCNLNIGKNFFCASDGVAEGLVLASGCIVNGTWLGPAITSGSAYGEAFIWGPLSACATSAS